VSLEPNTHALLYAAEGLPITTVEWCFVLAIMKFVLSLTLYDVTTNILGPQSRLKHTS
jgi:hypothetical protein